MRTLVLLTLGSLLMISGTLNAQVTTRASEASDDHHGNSYSIDPSISDCGRYVAFSSEAWNLVDNDVNGERDVFLHDRMTDATILISKSMNLN